MPSTGSILVVEDDRSMREVLSVLLRRHKFEVTAADGGEAGCSLLDQQEFDLVITDLKMPVVGGLEVLQHTRRLYPLTEVIVVTAFATTETAIAAMKQGAYDYLTKPYKVDEIIATVGRALEKRALVRENVTLREQLRDRYRLDRMVGRSTAMQQLFSLIRQVATVRSSVLITGESGTGKELVARAVHSLGERVDKPFVPVNCAAIPDALMESELFGHVRGAFTGATRDKCGLIATADQGTLFLDEIAELSPGMQVKLLRVLQERKVKPVGSVTEKEVDVRIIAATNRDLAAEVERGTFRSDLFYRLHVIPIHLPPLRQREGDVPLLAEHFMRKYSAEMGKPVRSIAPEALTQLCNYDFPGNVRELENIVERAVALALGDTIDLASLPALGPSAAPDLPDVPDLPEEGFDLDAYLGGIERRVLLQALERTRGNRTEAAQLLRMTLRSIRYRLAKFGVE